MNEAPLPYEISPGEAREWLDSGSASLLDVREPFEFAISHIEGGALEPMNTVPARLSAIGEAAANKVLIVYCHHGVRSLNTVHWLRANGVENCVSMARGIEGWSCEVDASVPRY